MGERDYQILEQLKEFKQPTVVDPVNSPSHYNAGAIETIDYITQVTDHYDGDVAYCIGNVLKYVSRAPLKGKEIEDLKKAQWYLNKALSLYQ